MDQTIIVLLIALLMIVLFVSNKFSYGLVTMTCCALLCLTGVCSVETAFSGLSNKIIILMAGMFVLSAALAKTSFTRKLQDMMRLMRGKKDTALVAIMCICVAIMVQFMPCTATLALMMTFTAALGTDGDVTESRVLLPLLVMTGTFWNATPLGFGATAYATMNAMVEGFVDESMLFTIFDKAKVAIFPAIISLVYCLMCWRNMPKYEIETDAAAPGTSKNDAAPYTKTQETIIYVLFIAVMIILMFFQNYSYIAPVVAILVLAYTKIMDLKEIVRNMTIPTIWMTAGILVISTCISNSGAGTIIGNTVLNILGGTQNQWIIMIAFALTTVIMTSFMSNIATYMILTPIAASVAAACGADMRALVLIVNIGSYYAWFFPTGSNQAAMVFAAAKYNPLKIAKFTIPCLLISTAALIVSASFWFPMFH